MQIETAQSQTRLARADHRKQHLPARLQADRRHRMATRAHSAAGSRAGPGRRPPRRMAAQSWSSEGLYLPGGNKWCQHIRLSILERLHRTSMNRARPHFKCVRKFALSLPSSRYVGVKRHVKNPRCVSVDTVLELEQGSGTCPRGSERSNLVARHGVLGEAPVSTAANDCFDQSNLLMHHARHMFKTWMRSAA